MPEYHGRLELTWTNKDLRLLAHEDGSYEWVPPADYRVAEVRLLRDIGKIGVVANDKARSTDNLLIRGDALNALSSLTNLPEFEREYVGKVRLAYLDPPFNTQQAFLQYDDALEHSVWLTMMRDRIMSIKTLLASDGSVWVHLDDSEMAYCRIMMDEVFGRENLVATVVWEKAQGPKGDTDIASAHDYIMIYVKSRETWRAMRNLLPRTEEQLARYANPDNDERGPWRQGADSTAKSGSEDNRYPITLPSGRQVVPAKGRYWAFSRETFERARVEKRVYFGAKGDSLPIIKTYISTAKGGVVPKTWWPATEVGSNQEAKRDHLNKLLPDVTPFETPKPERLLHRIMTISTNPGDIVLDCFLGSGTTAAVAHKMGRRWVGIERSATTLDTYAIPRLRKVINGDDGGGITDIVGWERGGGFRVLDIDPSMFTDEGGQIFLSDWATNGKLAEVTAAQLRYDYVYDPPFCGRRGRSRLTVIDGLVNEAVVRLLDNALVEDERVVVCGTSIDVAARDVLRSLRPGSSIRKIPQSILQDYQQVTRRGQYSRIDASPISGDSLVLDSPSVTNDTPQQTVAP